MTFLLFLAAIGFGAAFGWSLRGRHRPPQQEPSIRVSLDWALVQAALIGAGYRIVPNQEHTLQ